MVMRHSRAILYMDGYEPRELTARMRGRLEKHLAGCPDCERHHRESLEFREFLGGIGPVLPAGFGFAVESVRRQTLEGAQARPGAPRLIARAFGSAFRPFVASVGVAALLGLVFLLLPARQDGAETGRFALVRGPAAPSFEVTRSGSEVRIEFSRNGHLHRVRTGMNAARLGHEADRIVNGKVWTDPAAPQRPGSVTYYQVD